MDNNLVISEDNNPGQTSETVTLAPVAPETKDINFGNLDEYLYKKYYNEDGTAKPAEGVKEEDKKEDKKDESTEPEEKPKTDESKKETAKDEESTEEPDENPEDYYTLDEVDDDDVEPPSPLTQELNEYIYEKLPVIKANIIVDGVPQTVQVKIPSQLPPNFEFATKQEEIIFNNSLAEQTKNAERRRDEYFQQQNDIASKQFEIAERREIKQQMAELQKEGLLPTFTKNTPVDTDPRAEVARKVMDLYETENNRRIEASNRTGAPFSRITYRDAFDRYIRDNPVEVKEDKTAKELKAEDKERKEITSKNSILNRNSASGSDTEEQPKIPSTRRMSDMLPYLQQKYKVRS
jgi:hypothetical protein